MSRLWQIRSDFTIDSPKTIYNEEKYKNNKHAQSFIILIQYIIIYQDLILRGWQDKVQVEIDSGVSAHVLGKLRKFRCEKLKEPNLLQQLKPSIKSPCKEHWLV